MTSSATALPQTREHPNQPPGRDWALWHRARAGDEWSANCLVRELMPQALGLARQLLRRQEDAEDAVQEAFVRLWGSAPADDRGSRLSTYFNTIVINRCRTRLAARADVAMDDETLGRMQAGLPATAEPAHPMSGLSASSTSLRLTRAMQTLPQMQRMAIAMWAYGDASVVEIGRALGRDANAAHQILHRARRALRAQLERNGP